MPLGGQHSDVPMKQVSHGHFLSRTMLKHNVIFHEGSRGDSAYILTRGQVEISGTVNGRKKVFAILNPISIFGEMALLLDDETRTATATALADSEVIEVSRDALEEYLHHAPLVISSILTVVVARLKTTTKKALQVPSIPMTIVRILDLFAASGCMEINLERMVRSLSESLVTTEGTVTGYIYGLANEGFINIENDDSGKKVVQIRHSDFMYQVTESRKKPKQAR